MPVAEATYRKAAIGDKPDEHVAGRVHNSMHSAVELVGSPSSHSRVLRLRMEMLSLRRQR